MRVPAHSGTGALALELQDEKAAAQKWKRKAEEYKAQLVNSRGSGDLRPAGGAREQRSSAATPSSFVQRLSQAKADAAEWRRKAHAYEAGVWAPGGSNTALTKGDSTGWWSLDTSDAATRATLQVLMCASHTCD